MKWPQTPPFAGANTVSCSRNVLAAMPCRFIGSLPVYRQQNPAQIGLEKRKCHSF